MDIDYTYDDAYRLLGADSVSTDTALDYTKSWTYNSIGNILTSTDKGTYTYDGTATGDLTNPHAALSIGSTSLSYDDNGNLLDDGTWTNTWNYRNELTQSTDTGSVTYQYDHEGNRVLQNGSGSADTSLYPNQYYTVTPTDTLRHVFAGPLGSVATVSGDTLEATYHHKDHLGGIHVETDSTEAVTQYILYTPFGDTLYDSVSTGGNIFKYTGKEKDKETGYYYYGARYYNAGQGQFLSQDPIFLEIGTDPRELRSALPDPQSLNSYAYARNHPIRFIDPDGEKFWDTMKGLADTVTAYAPIASDVRDFVEVMRGRDAFTGVPISQDQKQMSALLLITPFASGSAYRKLGADDIISGGIQRNAARVIRSQIGSASGKTINGSVKIPSSWIRKSSDTGGGYKYIDPTNHYNEIRLMPGNPNSAFQGSRGPYMRVRNQSGYLDSNGNPSSDLGKTHHPITSIK